MKRSTAAMLLAFPYAIYGAASCATGSDLGGVGGGDFGSGATTGNAVSAGHGAGTTTAPSAVNSTATTGPGVGGSSASTAASVGNGGTISVGVGGAGGVGPSTASTGGTSVTTTGVSSSTTTVASSSSGMPDGGATGFGSCVNPSDLAQQCLPFHIGFCPVPSFACIPCSNTAAMPGDPVCSPNCVCTVLPMWCANDAGTD